MAALPDNARPVRAPMPGGDWAPAERGVGQAGGGAGGPTDYATHQDMMELAGLLREIRDWPPKSAAAPRP
jgi:hypothetical protein